jgi:hypothetical protein
VGLELNHRFWLRGQRLCWPFRMKPRILPHEIPKQKSDEFPTELSNTNGIIENSAICIEFHKLFFYFWSNSNIFECHERCERIWMPACNALNIEAVWASFDPLFEHRRSCGISSVLCICNQPVLLCRKFVLQVGTHRRLRNLVRLDLQDLPAATFSEGRRLWSSEIPSERSNHMTIRPREDRIFG